MKASEDSDMVYDVDNVHNTSYFRSQGSGQLKFDSTPPTNSKNQMETSSLRMLNLPRNIGSATLYKKIVLQEHNSEESQITYDVELPFMDPHPKSESVLLPSPTIKKRKHKKKSTKLIGGEAQRKSIQNKRVPCVPKNFTKKAFLDEFKYPVDDSIIDQLANGMNTFWSQMPKALAAYAQHSGRGTIKIEDVELYLKRCREVTTSCTFTDVVRTNLPEELIEKIIPKAVPSNLLHVTN